MEYADLLDLDTWYAVRKAAPKIAQVPYDRGQLAARALVKFSKLNAAHQDFDGQRYWEASLKQLT